MLKRILVLLVIGLISANPLFSANKEKFKPLPPPDFEALRAPDILYANNDNVPVPTPIENEVWLLFFIGLLLVCSVSFKYPVLLVFSGRTNN